MEPWKLQLPLKLGINVVLLGLDGSSDGLHVKSSRLQQLLSDVLPTYRVPLVRTKAQTGTVPPRGEIRLEALGEPQNFKLRYDISYSVKHASEESHDEYIAALVSKSSVDNSQRRRLRIPVSLVSQALETLAVKESGMAPSPQEHIFGSTDMTLLVANPSSMRIQTQVAQARPNDPPIHDGEYYFSGAESSTSVHEHHGTSDQPKTASTEQEEICPSSWMGKGRVLILDLAAAACNNETMRQASPRSSTVEETPPVGQGRDAARHGPLAQSRGTGTEATGSGIKSSAQGSSTSAADAANLLYIRLSSMVISATRTVLAPALPTNPEPGGISPVVMIPIILFREEYGHHTKTQGIDYSASNIHDVVDIDLVSRALEPMLLPNQKVVVRGAVHVLSNHPQVAVALAKSTVSETGFQSGGQELSSSETPVLRDTYVDSAKLLREMESAGDALTSLLVSDIMEGSDFVPLAGLDLALELERTPKDSMRFRVLPVFVFALGSEHNSYNIETPHIPMENAVQHFEDRSHFAAEPGGDAVVVLHHTQQSRTSQPHSLSATQSVVAGLMSGLYGTTPPNRWWRPGGQDADLDLTWAFGHHPFAPFGLGDSIPGELIATVARRNAVASRAVAIATSLAGASGVFEDFARAIIPSEFLLSVESRIALFGDGSVSRQQWSDALEALPDTVGLPSRVISPVAKVHRSLLQTHASFKKTLSSAPGMSVVDALDAFGDLRTDAKKILGEAKFLTEVSTRELEWCRCTVQREQTTAHASWMLYLGILILLLVALVRWWTTAHRSLYNYANTPRSGPRVGW